MPPNYAHKLQKLMLCSKQGNSIMAVGETTMRSTFNYTMSNVNISARRITKSVICL